MSREIQIEEMSADIQKLIHSTALSRALASHLYKWGWRKKSAIVREIFKDIHERVKPITKVVYSGEVIYESPLSLEELEEEYMEDK